MNDEAPKSRFSCGNSIAPIQRSTLGFLFPKPDQSKHIPLDPHASARSNDFPKRGNIVSRMMSDKMMSSLSLRHWGDLFRRHHYWFNGPNVDKGKHHGEAFWACCDTWKYDLRCLHAEVSSKYIFTKIPPVFLGWKEKNSLALGTNFHWFASARVLSYHIYLRKVYDISF